MQLKGLYYDLVNTQATKKVVNKNQKQVKNVVEDSDSSSDEEEEIKPQKETNKEDNFPKIVEKRPKAEKKKKCKKPKFKYELKLWKLQLPEIVWIIIGTIFQALNGAIFPGTHNF